MNEREELEALRRLAELEAKASGTRTNAAPTQFEREAMDPAGQMGIVDRLRAGIGSGLVNAAEGIAQLTPWGPSRASVDERRDRDVSLMASPGGFLGNALGTVAAAAPVGMALPATLPGAVAGGAIVGGAQPVGEQDSRTLNTVMGAGTSGAFKVGGDLLAKGLTNAIARQANTAPNNPIRNATLRDGQRAGYVLPPSEVRPTWLGNRLESIAGKDALKQESNIRNQAVTDALAGRAVGLAPGQPVTPGALDAVRGIAAQPYREIAELPVNPAARATVDRSRRAPVLAGLPRERIAPPTPVQDLEALKQARNDATKWFQYYERTGSPMALKRAERFATQAGGLEQSLDDAAQAAGRFDLLLALIEARRRIAKTHDVERALNLGDASVSAPVIGRMLDKGKPLTGELATIGRFQQAFPNFTREAAGTPAPGVGKLEMGTALLAGLGGAATAGPAGALAAGVPLLSSPVRAMLLSGPYQKAFVNPASPSTRLAAALMNNPHLQRIAPAAAASFVEQEN